MTQSQLWLCIRLNRIWSSQVFQLAPMWQTKSLLFPQSCPCFTNGSRMQLVSSKSKEPRKTAFN
jgi:hypothetical protein